MLDSHAYLNRELSWLAFNERVLHEAMDPRTPLWERLKLMAIFSANLDEFFITRIARLKQLSMAEVTQRSGDSKTLRQQLRAISDRLRPVLQQQDQYFTNTLTPHLAKAGLHILNYDDLPQQPQAYLSDYFTTKILPKLTPLVIDVRHPLPFVPNLSLNFAISLQAKTANPDQRKTTRCARLTIPEHQPRFIALPTELFPVLSPQPATWVGVPLENVIWHHLPLLFPQVGIQSSFLFRITRQRDLPVAEAEAEDLLLAIEQALIKRRLGGAVVRLEIQSGMSHVLQQQLGQEFALHPEEIYAAGHFFRRRDLIELLNLPRREAKDEFWKPVIPPGLARCPQLVLDEPQLTFPKQHHFFDCIRESDLVCHHPYHSLKASVEQFIIQAALDPHVQAIKMILYRTAKDSSIIQALMVAAEQGKQVTVLVELKARFAEAKNIHWARQLEQAGIHVVYGLPGLKTHAKVMLVVRQEAGKIRRYVQIGTGNYHSVSLQSSVDLSLISCQPSLGADISDLFNYLTGYSRRHDYRQILVSPINLRDRLTAMIQQEAIAATQGKLSRIVAQMNRLVDPGIIAALYQASQAGVPIDLIVCESCCLRPGFPGLSETIRVFSLAGHFREHARLWYFANGGQEALYLGSADWTSRDLDRCVDVMVPIKHPRAIQDILEMLGTLLSDNCHRWELRSDGSYHKCHSAHANRRQEAQKILMTLARQRAEGRE